MINRRIITLEALLSENEWRERLRGHLWRVMNGISSIHPENVNIMLKGIENRLGAFVSKASYLFFENEYNETAWKDMITLFYVNSADKLCTTVMRVHLFRGETASFDLSQKEQKRLFQQNYMGYFNIRPILGECCVSYAMMNYSNYSLTCHYHDKLQARIHMICYRRDVHINGFTVPIQTFPFFGRDNNLVVCAQADMIMMSRFVYRKLQMPELTLTHICQNKSKDRLDVFPTRGIMTSQMLDILYSRDIFIRNYIGSRNMGIKKDLSKETTNSFSLPFIGYMTRAYLDSGLPLFILIGKHVVIANGISEMLYTNHEPVHDRVLAVYDDSGALIHAMSGGSVMPIPFLGLCSWEQIKEYIINNTKENPSGIDIQIIVPLYQRITVDYPELVKIIFEYNILEGVFSREELRDPDRFINHSLWKQTRIFLIDCNKLKSELLHNSAAYWDEIEKQIDEIKDEISVQNIKVSLKIQRFLMNRIIAKGIPHYYWCLEIPVFSSDEEPPAFMYYVFNASPSMPKDMYEVCLNIIPAKELLPLLDQLEESDEAAGGSMPQLHAFWFKQAILDSHQAYHSTNRKD